MRTALYTNHLLDAFTMEGPIETLEQIIQWKNKLQGSILKALEKEPISPTAAFLMPSPASSSLGQTLCLIPHIFSEAHRGVVPFSNGIINTPSDLDVSKLIKRLINQMNIYVSYRTCLGEVFDKEKMKEFLAGTPSKENTEKWLRENGITFFQSFLEVKGGYSIRETFKLTLRSDGCMDIVNWANPPAWAEKKLGEGFFERWLQ